MEQATLGPERCLEIHQPRQDAEHLLEPFDVASRDRKQAELYAAFRGVRMKPLPPSDQSERL